MNRSRNIQEQKASRRFHRGMCLYYLCWELRTTQHTLCNYHICTSYAYMKEWQRNKLGGVYTMANPNAPSTRQ